MTEHLDPDLLLSHASFVRALALGLLHDRDLADDVVQETMLAAIRRPPRDVERLRGWLGTVARNLSFRARRGRARRNHRELQAARPDHIPSSAEVAVRLESESRLVSAVRDLGEPYRTTVVLRYYDGLGPSEIARRSGESVRTVETRLRRALAMLRTSLADTDGDDRSWRSGLFLVLGATPQAAAAPLAGGSTALALGSFLVSMKTKIAFAAAAILLLSLATWQVVENRPLVPPPVEPEVAAAGTTQARPPLPEAGPPAAKDAAVPPKPLSRDLGACHGRITHTDGTPVAGEKVWPWNEFGSAVTTDASGCFRLDGMEVEAAPRSLMIGPSDSWTSLGDVPIVPGGDIAADFTLPRGFPLTVLLRSRESQSCAGLRASLMPAKGEKGARSAHGISNAEGEVRFTGLQPIRYVLRVDGPGLRPHREALDLTAGPPAHPHRVELVPAEPLLVRVSNLRPGAQPEFILMISPVDRSGESFRLVGTVRHDGVIEEFAPPPGDYRLSVFVGGIMLPSVRVEVPRQGAVEARVDAPPGAEVTGRVIPANPDLSPKATIRLSCRERSTWTPQARIAKDGSFQLPVVPPGTYKVRLNLGDQELPDLIGPLRIGPEGLADLLVPLPDASGEIEGRLVGFSTDFPASAMRTVVFSRQEGDVWAPHCEVAPAYYGAFRVGFLPAGRWRIQFQGSPFGSDPDTAPVLVDLGPGERRTGIEIHGIDTAGVKLQFETAGGEPFTDHVNANATPESGGEDQLLMLKPDSDGCCTASGLSAGVWELVFLGGPGPLTIRKIEVFEGSREPITIRLW